MIHIIGPGASIKMENELRSRLMKIGFKQSESGDLQFEFQGINFVAILHPTIGLCLVVSYSGKDAAIRFEEYLPADSTTKEIANTILGIYGRILPEEAAIQENNFRRKYGSLRP